MFVSVFRSHVEIGKKLWVGWRFFGGWIKNTKYSNFKEWGLLVENLITLIRTLHKDKEDHTFENQNKDNCNIEKSEEGS